MSDKTKVLVVDDEVHIVTAIQFLLEDNGFEVKTAHNGLEALEVLKTFQPSTILLDVMMPRMNGLECAQAIRQNPDNYNMKIIFLTAKSADRDKLAGYQSGAEVYLTKPFDNQELIDVVSEMAMFG